MRQQATRGVDVVDDGEFSKSSWGTYINERVFGFHDATPNRDMAINYTVATPERFAEFFESQGRGGNVRRWRGADVVVGPIDSPTTTASSATLPI